MTKEELTTARRRMNLIVGSKVEKEDEIGRTG
jgi:hypothetical protein